MVLAEFENFIQQYEKDIFSFCCYLTMDRSAADDLYQDTVLRALEIIDGIEAARNPKSLLFSIAVGKWKNVKRRAERRNEITRAVLFDDFMEVASAGDNPENRAIDNLLKTCVRNSVAKMDDKFRIPLILFYFDDFDVEAIARICKIPQGTVKSRLHKGRAILRESLKKEGFDNE